MTLPNDYTPGNYSRLQMYDKVGGTLWAGCEAVPGELSACQLVWAAAEDFSVYVNRLLDAWGHLDYQTIDRIARDRAKRKGTISYEEVQDHPDV